MNIFDSHCHLQFPQYYKDKDEMIKRALQESVFMICVGTDLETSKKAIELAENHKNIWATVGLHPNDNLNEKFNVAEYEKLFKKNEVVAMGEIGLDYYRTEKEKDQKFQKERFIEQLDLAKKIGVPLILHCRDSKASSTGRAYPQMIDILKNGYTVNGGIVHSYTGSLDEAKEFLNLGLYFGFNGIITFARQYDEIIKYIPLENILLETDAPFLTPVPHRGKINEPLYVKHVAEKIAELKSLSYSQVAEKTFQNTMNLFRIKI
jgi:TatD DNase family protein